MPLRKNLVPFLSRSQQQRLQKITNLPVTKVLSPVLPSSPQQKHSRPVNDNGDNIIGLSMEEDNDSSKSSESLTIQTQSSENINKCNAVVLYEKPTSFELCDNDLIIESVKDVEDEVYETSEEDTMRDHNAMTVYRPSAGLNAKSMKAAGYTSLVHLFDQDSNNSVGPPKNVVEVNQAVTDTLPSLTSSNNMAGQIQDAREFIKPIQAEVVQQEIIFSNSKLVLKAVEERYKQDQSMNAFKKAGRSSSIKHTYHKMIRSAKSLVRKAQSSNNNSDNSPANHDSHKLRSINSELVSGNDERQKVKEITTPIYNLRQTCETSLSKFNFQPEEPYRSPVLGSFAYEFKVFCDQSFFGRW